MFVYLSLSFCHSLCLSYIYLFMYLNRPASLFLLLFSGSLFISRCNFATSCFYPSPSIFSVSPLFSLSVKHLFIPPFLFEVKITTTFLLSDTFFFHVYPSCSVFNFFFCVFFLSLSILPPLSLSLSLSSHFFLFSILLCQPSFSLFFSINLLTYQSTKILCLFTKSSLNLSFHFTFSSNNIGFIKGEKGRLYNSFVDFTRSKHYYQIASI